MVVPLFWGDLITLNKVYDVEESDEYEYWIDTDNDEHNPIPKEFFELID